LGSQRAAGLLNARIAEAAALRLARLIQELRRFKAKGRYII